MKGGARAQASLEMVIASIGILMLLVASLKVFIWTCESLRDRQQGYDRTRVRAADPDPGSLRGTYIDFEPGTQLRFFDE
jgi:hypothetical protein